MKYEIPSLNKTLSLSKEDVDEIEFDENIMKTKNGNIAIKEMSQDSNRSQNNLITITEQGNNELNKSVPTIKDAASAYEAYIGKKEAEDTISVHS